MSVSIPNNARGPRLDVTLPKFSDPVEVRFRNETTGLSLALFFINGWAAGGLHLDFFRRTIRDDFGNDRSGSLVAADHELWIPEPMAAGDNDLEIEVVELAFTKFPGTPGSLVDLAAGSGTVAWASPGNAATSNNSRATATLTAGQVSHVLAVTDIDFGVIPAGSRLSGISVEVERSAESETTAPRDAVVQLLQAGQLVGANYSGRGSGPWGTSDKTITYGNLVDLWGAPLALPDILDSDFGVGVAARASAVGGNQARIDLIRPNAWLLVPSGEATAIDAEASLTWDLGHH